MTTMARDTVPFSIAKAKPEKYPARSSANYLLPHKQTAPGSFY